MSVSIRVSSEECSRVPPETHSQKHASRSWRLLYRIQIKIVGQCASVFRLQLNHSQVKYIALLAMVKIVPSHPHLVAQYQDTILASVSDQDISIRMRALDLVSAMVTIYIPFQFAL